MKNKFWLGLVLGALLVFGLSASRSYFEIANNRIKDSVITVEVNNNAGKLEFKKDNNSKCPQGNGQNAKYGCIDVAFDDQGRIALELKPSSWHMTEMKICKGDSEATQICNLNADEQKEFAVKIDGNLTRYPPGQNGVIKFGAETGEVPGEISEFKFLSLNNIKTETTYFYTLKACNNNDHTDCVDTDPMIKNGGRQ